MARGVSLRLDVLLIDTDVEVAQAVATLLAIFHDVRIASDLRTAIGELSNKVPDVVLSDLDLEPFRGDMLLGMVAREYPTVRRVLFTGEPPEQWAHVLDQNFAHSVVQKPGDIKNLLDAISGRR